MLDLSAYENYLYSLNYYFFEMLKSVHYILFFTFFRHIGQNTERYLCNTGTIGHFISKKNHFFLLVSFSGTIFVEIC
jgi:hypothetical protein